MLRDMLSGIHPNDALQMEWRRGTPARQARLAHRHRDPRAGHAARIRASPTGRSPRRRSTWTSTSWRPPAHRHRPERLRPAPGVRRVPPPGRQQLLAAWIPAVALSANDEDHNWTGAGDRPAAPRRQPSAGCSRRLVPTPVRCSADLVDVYDLGRQEPLPLPLKTSFAWAQARQTGDDPVAAAESKWLSKRWDGETPTPPPAGVGRHATSSRCSDAPARRGRSGRDHPPRRVRRPRLGADAAVRAGGAWMRALRPAGRLPTGTTVLEASAGTGKTHTVAGLVTRYVAEGHATLDADAASSPSAASPARNCASGSAGSWWRPNAGWPTPTAVAPTTSLLGRLWPTPTMRATRPSPGCARPRAFRRATIATTHQFCQQVLRVARGRGGQRTGRTLVDDLDELVVEVIDDLYLQRFGGADEPPRSATPPRCSSHARPSATRTPDSAPQTPIRSRPSVRRRFAPGRARGGRPAQAAARGCSATTTC